MQNLINLPHSVAELLKSVQKFKMAAVRHLELLFCYPGQPTKCYCLPEVCVQISCKSDLYLRRYLRSNISQVFWLKMPIRAPMMNGIHPVSLVGTAGPAH